MSTPTDMTLEQAREIYTSLYGSADLAAYDAAWAQYGATVSADELVNTMKARGGILDIGEWETQQILSGNSSAIGISAKQRYMVLDNPIDSNSVTTVTRKIPVNTTVTQTGKINARAGLREAGTFAMGTIVPAVAAASVGIWLGRTVDSALYNLNPNFWDSQGMSSLNPDTWDSITSDDDSLSSRVFNTILGIDDNGNTTAYLDEDAVAYLAKWLDEQQFFVTETSIDATNFTRGTVYTNDDIPLMTLNQFISTFASGRTLPTAVQTEIQRYGHRIGIVVYLPYSRAYEFRYAHGHDVVLTSTGPYPITRIDTSTAITNVPVTFTSADLILDVGTSISYGSGLPVTQYTAFSNKTVPTNGYSGILGNVTIREPLDGVGSQSGATLPNTSGWQDVDSTKQSLQQQYPDTWTNSKHQDYVDENGNQRSKTYLPIPLPDKFSNNQPTTGDSDQNRTDNNEQNIPESLVKTLTDILTQLLTPGSPGTPTPDSPTDTGSGDTGTTVMPVGQASSLWKIYNPTQAQVDSFGAWLWSSNLVDQIKKLFNDPMQAVIGIHKVFASPSTGGTTTIKVGYLDSEVSSNWVDNQYTTIDCGTVNLSEVFGNVFDYAPYTKVSIYLPFIGVVDLDVADVMRSKIQVKYHVDVLSGACLAEVKVNRDGAGGVLYQYAGSAIVTYPVSAGNYVGMLAGVMSVAGGIAGTILSGGAAAPAIMGGMIGASHLHTDVSHSGGFSGCAGAMGGKKPYLIISRPQTALANNYKHFTGIPANKHATLSQCSGLTKVKTVYVGAISYATNEEKEMIETKLKEGVLI